MLLTKGDLAPVFSLFATPDQKLSLADLNGKRVILAFYPSDWSPVCGDQMALYNEVLKFFSQTQCRAYWHFCRQQMESHGFCSKQKPSLPFVIRF